jgi:kumamolisin
LPFEKRVTLQGSDRRPIPGFEEVSTPTTQKYTQVTVVLERKTALPASKKGAAPKRIPHAKFAAKYGADPAAIDTVERFAHYAGLTVVQSSVAKRRVVLSGPTATVANAFGAQLVGYKSASSDGATYLGRAGSLTIPEELQGHVMAVLGIDSRPIAHAHILRRPRQTPTTTYTPPQVAALYNFPASTTASGQSVGIIELGGGYRTSDLDTYFSQLNVTAPAVTAVSVDGGTNSPGSDTDGEVMLDIEVVGSVAPGVNIAVYFAPNTDQGFIDAITDAVHDANRKISVVSISWGGSEDSWTQQSQTAMNAALQDAATLGVTVLASAGDSGSSDGETDGNLHVDFPASSPYILACGGTKLQGSGTAISSEVVWNETTNQEGATGGGVSAAFALPSWQSSAKVPAQPKTGFVGRGVPDVAGNADPSTGYQVLVDGQSEIVGGTSAVAPLWAGLIALINQQLGAPLGFLNPQLYSLGESDFRDITSGNNDDSGLGYYSAGPGWDACTGLGSPNGAALLAALKPK